MDLELCCRGRLADVVGCGEADALMYHAGVVALADGEPLFVQGQPSSSLFLLCDGELRLSTAGADGPTELGVVEAGSWLGELGFVDPGPSTATATARGACSLVKLDHEALGRLIDDDPVLAGVILEEVNRALGSRLRRSTAVLVEHASELDKRDAGAGRWVAQALGRLVGGDGRGERGPR